VVGFVNTVMNVEFFKSRDIFYDVQKQVVKTDVLLRTYL